jgi:hypothetical protein
VERERRKWGKGREQGGEVEWKRRKRRWKWGSEMQGVEADMGQGEEKKIVSFQETVVAVATPTEVMGRRNWMNCW